MAKRPISLEGIVNQQEKPIEAGILQQDKAVPTKKRKGEKRLTVALDETNYRRLKLYAAREDKSHQFILETALADFLNKVSA